MEPTMPTDNKSQEPQVSRADKFTICDLTDEEVHFSRDASDYYYQMSDPGNNNHDQCHFVDASINPVNTHNLEFHSLPTNYHNHSVPLSSDQVRSNRLLQSLGNKLRRGSDYINAPTRILGQYLLGITIQSWLEFFNTGRMRAPCTRLQLSRRLATNLSYFQGNYLCVSLILVIYCILTSPLLLIAIAAYLFALYLVTVRSALGKQMRLFGYRLNLQQQYSIITMFSLSPLWIAGAPGAVFWAIGASFFAVGLHASMYMNNQVMNEQLAEPDAHVTSIGETLSASVAYNQGRYVHLTSTRSTSDFPVVHYYNHYPKVEHESPQQGYLAVSKSGGMVNTTGSYQTRGATTVGSYLSSTISQWINFGGRGSGAKYTLAKDLESILSSSKSSSFTGQRVPEVKIISQDYAGLGRVYEV